MIAQLFVRSEWYMGRTDHVVALCHRPFKDGMRSSFYNMRRQDFEKMFNLRNKLPMAFTAVIKIKDMKVHIKKAKGGK